MAQAKSTLQDLFQAQDWYFGHILTNTRASEFIQNSGILTSNLTLNNSFSQAVNYASVPDLIHGFIRSHKGNNFLLSLEDRKAEIAVADDEYHRFRVKTNSRQFFTSLNIFEGNTRYGSMNVLQFLQNTLGNDVYNYMLELMCSIVNNLTYVGETTEGDGLGNFSKALVDNLLSKTENSGNYNANTDDIIGMYMNKTTLNDILSKQTAGTITSTLIDHPTSLVITNNSFTSAQSNLSSFVYLNGTPVYTLPFLKDGVIAIFKRGAFYFDYNDFNDPIMMYDIVLQQGGREKILQTQASFIMHPNGFSFKGIQGTDYAKASGVTAAENNSATKALFEVLPDDYVNFAKILTMKVKVGT